MNDPIDTGLMRREWPIDDDHKATLNPNHCNVCHLRMPCDWSSIVADLHRALDEVDSLRAVSGRSGIS